MVIFFFKNFLKISQKHVLRDFKKIVRGVPYKKKINIFFFVNILSFDKVDKNPSKLNNKLNELKNKFEKAKQVVNNMNGIQMSYIEQQEYYNSLLKQYELKLELLDSYKSTCSFDTSEIQYENTSNNDLYSNIKLNFNENNQQQIKNIDQEHNFETSDDIDMDFMGNI
jgi:hypothetical protein